MYRLKAYKNVFLLIAFLVVISVLFLISANGANERVVYVRDGGNGNGSAYESAIGDFKQAVKMLKTSIIVRSKAKSFFILSSFQDIKGLLYKFFCYQQ